MANESPPQDDAPHRNTPESIEKGNALLAEAKGLRDMGIMFCRQIDELEKIKAQAYRLATDKQYEAEVLLVGRPAYRY